MAFLAGFALCVLAFHLTAGKSVEFQNCGSKLSNLTEVDITPCLGDPCQLKRGTEESIQVTFTPYEDITAATTVVHGIISGVQVPFPVDQPKVCKDHGIVCPMAAKKAYTFKAVLPVKSIYPLIQVDVKWEMKDQNGTEVYCWIVPAKIVE